MERPILPKSEEIVVKRLSRTGKGEKIRPEMTDARSGEYHMTDGRSGEYQFCCLQNTSFFFSSS
jgi:hypothetical protein